ncbi:MAG: hypothetical protein IT580_03570 [Verrucomicrobiales bacterium]|nr:hypothetical protein [Verrucomicrobiales bacterium]
MTWAATVPATWAGEFRAAIAVRAVTPDPLLPVSGGIGIPEPATRKAGELTVRALVLADADTRVAMVSVDFLGWPAVLGDKTRARVKSVPADHILIGATHTHSAPDPYAFPDPNGRTGADLAYLDSVAARLAEAIEDAASRLKPASLRVATGAVRGKIAYNAYAEALFDPRCSVLQVMGADGQPLATLVNYAVHPEVFGSRAGVCSPDLIGPLYDRLAEKGAGTGIFFNGAQGGMVTADNRAADGRDQSTWEECQRIGRGLADEALRLLEGAAAQSDPVLECRSATVLFPVESPVLRAVLKGSPMGYHTDAEGRVSTRLNAVRVGDAHLVTIPGEALPNIGAYLKRKMHAKHNLLLGLTNDAFGYILTREDWGAFPRYEYISRTSLGESTGEILVRAALELEAQLGSR